MFCSCAPMSVALRRPVTASGRYETRRRLRALRLAGGSGVREVASRPTYELTISLFHFLYQFYSIPKYITDKIFILKHVEISTNKLHNVERHIKCYNFLWPEVTKGKSLDGAYRKCER